MLICILSYKLRYMTSFFQRSALLFVALFAVTLPFPLSFFETPGSFLHPFFETWNRWTATHILRLAPGYTSAIESDNTGLYIHLLHLILLSLAGAFAWQKITGRPDALKLRYLLHASATYILAFFLLKYGFDKIFKVQFYWPEPNTLYTPLGYLSKDILFWSAAGSSYLYSFFSGLMEILPALLLFSRRTRLLGGCIAFGVMLHVLVINFAFDISVKILSTYLLLLAILVLVPYAGALYKVLWAGGSQFARPAIESVNRDKNKVIRLIKALLICFFLFESLFIYVESGVYNDDLSPRPELHGAYELIDEDPVTQLRTTRGISSVLGNLAGTRRVFMHRKGYLILQRADDTMKDFKASAGSGSRRIKLSSGDKRLDIFTWQDPKTGNYIFSWKEKDSSFTLVTKKLSLDELPLRQDGFTWNVDSY